jgi:hypothetical protein
MFRPTQTLARRGQMLIVVLLLITLFSIVGIVFVYYTGALASRMRMTGEAAALGGTEFPRDGTQELNAFLASLIYPVNEADPASLTNALRGHDLTRTMYGYYGDGTAWNGIGTFHEPVNTYQDFNGTPYGLPPTGPNSDRSRYINHTALLFNNRSIVIDPEFTGVRPKVNNANTFDVFPIPGNTPRTYVPKNAPYTYPDIKDLYLAAICPATGEVLIPSFHRPWVFGSLVPPTPSGTGGNPNWTNPIGKFLTLRPRPIDQYIVNGVPQFPYVPANPDGSYTGDVQNLPGGVGPQRNDSLWMDIGLPAFTWNNRRVKPLVAPLILCLDGRLNLSVHGNQMNSGSTTSMAGFGPSEVNFGAILGASDAQQLINSRGTPQTRSGLVQREFNRYAPGVPLPQYSAVAWRGVGGANSFALPGQVPNSLYYVNPIYGGGYDSTNTPIANHASLFNPNEWPATPGLNRTYALADTKYLNLRYAFEPTMYSPAQLNLAGALPLYSLRGDQRTNVPTSFPFPASPITATTYSKYRLDPAHANRLLFTTRSFALDLPGLMPNFRSSDSGMPSNALVFDPTLGLVNQNSLSAYPDPVNVPLGTLSDFDRTSGGGAWRNASVRQYGAVDLNTPLTDHRSNTTQPLSPANIRTDGVPELDRQRLAMKIFQRLVIATGAHGQPMTDPTTGDDYVAALPTDPNSGEFRALRMLAQMAANMVDAIDNDDICTTFVWNPVNPTINPLQDVNNFANLANHVVFGTEKPRLVINEVYAEVTNDPADQAFQNAQIGASNPAQVRFWLELQNPTAAPYSPGSGVGPLGDPSATNPPAGSVKLRDMVGNTPYSPYRIEIVRSAKGGGNVSDLLRNTSRTNAAYFGNVTGNFGTTAPDVIFDFSPAVIGSGLEVVAPANGNPNLPASIRLLAAHFPGQAANTPGDAFDGAGFPPAITIQATPPANATTSSLTYFRPLPPDTGSNQLDPTFAAEMNQHIVALRRLANPYQLLSASNPYITIDFVDYVQAHDVIYLPQNRRRNNMRPAKQWLNNAISLGYDPITPPGPGDPIRRRASLGKVQPYAGYAFAQNPPNDALQGQTVLDFGFPASMALRADPAGWNGGVKHTFGRHNGVTQAAPTIQTFIPGPPARITVDGTVNGNPETLMTPFDWLIHYDRPLINQLELLHLHAGKPHELTLNFMVPNSVSPGVFGVKKYAGVAPWLPEPVQGQTVSNALYRALELLRVQPYGHQMAFGGRVPGRININTIQDRRQFQAWLDSQPGNSFSQADIDIMWDTLIRSRTPNLDTTTRRLANGTLVPGGVPVPGESVYDNPAGTGDRPFMPFGVAESIAGGSFALTGGSGIDDTLLRRNPPIYVNPTSPGRPAIWVPNAPTAADPNPYLQAEAARKLFNNFTTVSHTFAVYVTVGYFEVHEENNPPPNWPSMMVGGQPRPIPYPGKLGKEVYKEIPGDLRQKFFAIVDRSNLAPIVSNSPVLPIFTTLEANAPAGSTTIQVSSAAAGVVYSDGVAVAIPQTLYIGQPGGLSSPGVTGTVEQITVTGVQNYANGISTLTIQGAGPGNGLLHSYPAGVCVSNVRPGGQPLPSGVPFDANGAAFRPVVPFVARVP